MSRDAIFFCTEEFSDTPLLYLHFHVSQHCVRLPLCCHLSHGNMCDGILVGRFNLYCGITTSDVGQYHKIGDITFRAALIDGEVLWNLVQFS